MAFWDGKWANTTFGANPADKNVQSTKKFTGKSSMKVVKGQGGTKGVSAVNLDDNGFGSSKKKEID
jgi:hypothetical protein